MTGEQADVGLVELTADIVSAYVSTNKIIVGNLPKLIGDTFDSLRNISAKASLPLQEQLQPAIPIKKSITPDYIFCLEDGKKFKTLKRHLRTYYDLSPEDYREKWGLPYDYPMVSPNYAATRSAVAKKIGFGKRKKD